MFVVLSGKCVTLARNKEYLEARRLLREYIQDYVDLETEFITIEERLKRF